MQSEVVSSSPDVMHGVPVIKGTRVPVSLFFEFIKEGGTVDEFLEQYPSVARIQVEQLLSDAAERVAS